MRGILGLVLLFVCWPVQGQKIALSFDDAPLGDSPVMTGVKRTELLIKNLKAAAVPAVAFLCVSSRLTETGRQRLRDYAEAGHILGNHTHSHARIHRIGVEAAIKDIEKAHELLRELPGFERWFRFPFLDEGRDRPTRDALRDALEERNYFNAYVTVDNYDFALERLFRDAVRDKKPMDRDAMKRMYLDHLWNSIQFYDHMAQKALGRSPIHVLLLHENDLAALYIGDLVTMLRAKGWEIVSPREAYRDPIATQIPDVLLNNQGRVAALAKARNYPGPFSQASENTETLRQQFEKTVLMAQ